MVILTNAPEAYDYGATTPLPWTETPLPVGFRMVEVLMPYAPYQMERYKSGMYAAVEVVNVS